MTGSREENIPERKENIIIMNKQNWKVWLYAAGVRAVKTFAQTFASMITVGAAISELDWGYIASVATVSAVYSLVTSLAGLPEVSAE